MDARIFATLMVMISKLQAREDVRRKLSGLSEMQFEDASKKINAHVDAVLTEQRVSSALLYSAVYQWREVDLSWVEKHWKIRCDYVALDSNAPFSANDYDAIFVPLFGFNDTGYRLGRGSGWYDRFLALHQQVVKVGVGLEAGNINFDIDRHDIPMDIIITEKGVKSYGPRHTAAGEL